MSRRAQLRRRNRLKLCSWNCFHSALVPFRQPWYCSVNNKKLCFAADSHCWNSSGFGYCFQHYGNPLYLNLSKAASLHYAVPTTSFWKCFSLQHVRPFPELCWVLQRKSVALTWSEPSNPPSVLLGAPIVQACRCLFLQTPGLPANTCKHLENSTEMATPLWTPVKATLMQAAFCKASFFPFPSSVCSAADHIMLKMNPRWFPTTSVPPWICLSIPWASVLAQSRMKFCPQWCGGE